MVDWVVEMPLMLLACKKISAHMLTTMHVVRFQPSGCSGAGTGGRSLAGEASRAVTELDSERSRGVSSATVGEVAELSSSPRWRWLNRVVILHHFRIRFEGSRWASESQLSHGVTNKGRKI